MNATYTAEQLAKIIATFATERDIAPDEDYTADAGRDYGYVAAWEMPDGGYAVAYGDNGQTNYDLADDADDLAAWLESPDLYDEAAILQTANVRGLDAIQEAGEGADSYAILISYDYYGPVTRHSIDSDESGETIRYSTLDEALAAIEEMDSGVYVTDHNEIGRPTYTVVAL